MEALNRALALKKGFSSSPLPAERGEISPCIFLIHHSAARKATEIISDYIVQRGQVDIYLDLSAPLDISAPDKPFLQIFTEGLEWSSHIMILSPPDSFPQQALFLECMQNFPLPVSLLMLKDHASVPAVPHLEILGGIKSLNEYLMRISPENNTIIFNNPDYDGLLAHTAPRHPLDAYLNWRN
ncbi:MAG: hypothetical protein LBV07_03600 [Syntrophobacterales bacterium]|jgi:hypothetical protein|nr:hypothetical protein [Syntrophobacterales bacterium]